MKTLTPLLIAALCFTGCDTDSEAEPTLSSASDGGVWSGEGEGEGEAEFGGQGGAGGAMGAPRAEPPEEEPDTERFEHPGENPFINTEADPLSTFSIDTDTASYTLMRSSLMGGRLPSVESVRAEEWINFFRYDYPAPGIDGDSAPFAVHTEAAPSPFGEGLHLLRIGMKAQEVAEANRAPPNPVSLVDVSGSMQARLPLVKYALSTLSEALSPEDTLSIVTYAGADRVVLPPTPVGERGPIFEAIEAMRSGGGTNGAAGIRTAYDLASEAFVEGGINRVVLCTDGDFNVGITNDALVEYVEDRREENISLSVLGFGRGNFNDQFLEELTNRGEGNYAFIDSRNEALRVLGQNIVGTLQVVAKDVKIQVEFDASTVARFRLIGYANRVLAHEDFRDDQVDAAEIGAGHTVTALYEVELHPEAEGDTLATVRVRSKRPEGGESVEGEFPLGRDRMAESMDGASADFRFAAAVAEFAEVLSEGMYSEGARFEDIRTLALGAMSEQADRQEFLQLLAMAEGLWQE